MYVIRAIALTDLSQASDFGTRIVQSFALIRHAPFACARARPSTTSTSPAQITRRSIQTVRCLTNRAAPRLTSLTGLDPSAILRLILPNPAPCQLADAFPFPAVPFYCAKNRRSSRMSKSKCRVQRFGRMSPLSTKRLKVIGETLKNLAAGRNLRAPIRCLVSDVSITSDLALLLFLPQKLKGTRNSLF